MRNRVKAIQFFLFKIIEEENDHCFWTKIWIWTLSSIIFINILSIILETVDEFKWANDYFIVIEKVSLIFFTIEYLLKIWIAPLSRNFISFSHTIFKTILLAYLIILLPYWITWASSYDSLFEILVMARIFRIFLLKKPFTSIAQIFSIIYTHRATLLNILFLIFSVLLVAATAMYHAEHSIQPDKFPNIIQAFYWAIITFATIGYGDIYPITFIGKAIAGIVAGMGVLLYSLPTYVIGSAFYEEVKSTHAKERDTLREKIKSLEAEKKQNETIQKKEDIFHSHSFYN